MKKTHAPTEVSEIIEVTRGNFECCILGTTPLIMNRMAEKAKRELLMPKGRKNASERATSLKHQPVEEYRASAYRLSDPDLPTLLGMPSTAFKRAIGTAALDMPGAKKAQIGRLTYVSGQYVHIYGVQNLFMSIVRSADINKTPDVRTRALLPRWACRVNVTYIEPLIRAQAVANLLSAAGHTIGIGDYRQEKGAGSYGLFQIVDAQHPEFLDIIATGGRAAQQAAMDVPVCYDDDTAELFDWYNEERGKRDLRGVA